MARFVVGIDLGTTNSALAFAPAEPEDDGAPAVGAIRAWPIPQVVAPGEVDERTTLPSFLLLPTELEMKPEAMATPWSGPREWAVGEMARERGAELPLRLVSSAKSWLSYSGVDRTAAVLPWRGAAAEQELAADGISEGARVSPLEASARYLDHLRAAWDQAHPDAPLAEQDVFLTVPASFDAVARELTVTAARQAGIENPTLLEEPQAAFYSFLARAGDEWRKRLRPGDVIVVVDVGGGTCDFSLIAVSDQGGDLVLERVAVGDHILLGGDNMDLTLAHAVSQRVAEGGKKLSAAQFRALVHACRRGKETLLGDSPPAHVPITILGGGSRLIGGTIKTKLERADVERLLVDGFAPSVAADAAPRAQRALGLRELGLPYATDPAMTRHLASFLARHGRRPTAILFNGGVMKGATLARRVTEVVSSWFGGDPIPVLGGTDLDLAVAHGAAYYGLVRRGRGIRIRGGTARAYYIGVESAMPAIPGFAPPVKALCVAPFGMEEGTRVDVPGRQLGLLVGEPTVFRFFASSSRKEDRPGQIVDPDEAELAELAPVETHLPAEPAESAGQVVAVTLEAHVTEIGTLELWSSAAGDAGRWKLEYSLREDPDRAADRGA
jgi:molecular chaperone DnaK (HSP70)